ncbi:MAG: SDR family oxidoreductase [Burkholderiales bacterium]
MSVASSTEPAGTRTVLVTGAARRLGREIALTLARAGWQVAVHYRGSEADARRTVTDCATLSGAAAEFQANLANEAECRALLPRVIAHFGSVDAVVNNASLFDNDTAASFSYDKLQRHMAANVGPAVLLGQALQAHLMSRAVIAAAAADAPVDVAAEPATGVVVNLLDQKLWNPNPDHLSYTLSKAALEAATTLLAQALAPQVRVVGVAPGLTLASRSMSDVQFERLHRISPLGRSSTAADVASAVRFAIENGSITGSTLLIDGGQHLQPMTRDFSMLDEQGDDAPPATEPQA